GAEQLIANQKPEGNWDKGGTGIESPVIDTCFALLFLSQANLAEDLADRLKMEAQLVAKPPDIPPAKIEPPPDTANPVPSPPGPTRPPETPSKPEAGAAPPESQEPQPPPVAPLKQAATP